MSDYTTELMIPKWVTGIAKALYGLVCLILGSVLVTGGWLKHCLIYFILGVMAYGFGLYHIIFRKPDK